MEDYGLVSIITPSWNCGQYIGDTIQCVLDQTYRNWELIIMDDCSTDNTRAVVEPYLADARIHYCQNEKNMGAAMTRNRALQLEKGRWVAFLDSDDLWEPTKLQKQLRVMVENGMHFTYTAYQEMDEEGHLTGVVVTGPRRITRRGMYNFCWPGCLTVMYDADVVGLVQIADIKKNNDYAMWLIVSQKADCYLIPEVLGTYRRGRSGSVSTHSFATMIKWHYRLFHEAEKMSAPASVYHTSINMVCGLYKKIKYVKRFRV